MTDDEANAMLKQLSEHFKCPVKPIDQYCNALTAWGKAVYERGAHLRNELFPGLSSPWDTQTHKDASEEYQRESRVTGRLNAIYASGAKPTPRDHELEELKRYEQGAESINHVFLQIRKSCLLDRILYGGQKIRTQMCPEHKGHWSGLEHDTNYCKHGCQFTGWLPEPEDKPPFPPGVFQWTSLNPDGSVSRELRKDGLPYVPEGASPPPAEAAEPGPLRHNIMVIDPNPLERK